MPKKGYGHLTLFWLYKYYIERKILKFDIPHLYNKGFRHLLDLFRGRSTFNQVE